METTVSTTGQVVIPKTIREKHQLSPGTRLEIEDLGDHIVLRRIEPERTYTVDDLLALPKHYEGPTRTPAEMKEAVGEDVRRRWSR